MKKKKYIYRVGNDFVITSAFSKSEAFMNARLMGYNGEIKGIRIYSE